MNRDEPVPLVRRFGPAFQTDDSDGHEVHALMGYPNFKTWPEIDRGYRSVILAEAGAGKTFEMRARARNVRQQGNPSFFIRIEDIADAFEDAFEVGSAESFTQWLESQDEAWFYLDSVDEARLDNPTSFEKAIRHFSRRIRPAQLRAHICISSRPYAWRAKSDRELVHRHLPFKKPRAESSGADPKSIERAGPPDDAFEVLFLQPLEESDIRTFAVHRAVPDIDRLLQELERSNLMALAGRPFDLDEILDKWKADLALGSRRDLLHHSVERRLGELCADRIIRQPLNPEKARSGARALAAAVVLTGKACIRVLDGGHAGAGIDPQAVLADWQPDEVQNLLARAVFDDVTYRGVRFRQRDVRELLAAEWFSELLQRGHFRHAVETLFFREQYGVRFISPRLRVVLPWLILDDGAIRNQVLVADPEIAMEGGDPALLPLPERKKILTDIVDRIARGEDDGTARDNHAIARIAQPDLAPEASALIDRHADNDDAIFFLGRFVWQGEISECVPPMIDLAADPARGVFARIAAVRAVMTCGTRAHKATLWDRVRTTQRLPRELLAELVQDTEADAVTVKLLLESIEKLPPYERFQTTGLTQALHGFIERLPLPSDANGELPISTLVAGFRALLRRPPFIEPSECHVSEEFAWLLGSAIHAVERLVADHSEAALCEPSLEIMLSAPGARQWHDRGIDDHKERLGELVPAWPELNDCLFWQDVNSTRNRLKDEGKRLDDDWPVQWPQHYWSFGPDSFSRILEWLSARDIEDDRLVALSLGFRVYRQARGPAEWLERLRVAVTHDSVLTARLDTLLNPPVPEKNHKWQRREAERRRRLERQEQEDREKRLAWIDRLRADPDLVRSPPGLQPGEVSGDQWGLLREIEGDGLRTSRAQASNWRSLIDEFGEDVAVAYRDAAMAHWRQCKPGLGSEGADTRSIPSSVVFAMAGLAIEANEVEGFPGHLCASEARLALRYNVWELNGFPAWLETMYRARPEAVMESIEAELFWELAHTEPAQPMHYILHDLAVYAPWLHGSLTSSLLTWLRANDPPSDDALHHIFRILKGGSPNLAELAALAKVKATQEDVIEHRPYWYAMWIDTDPDTGIEAIADLLAGLEGDEASRIAQLFIVALMGSGHGMGQGYKFEKFLTPRHLKRLYALMHEHIRVSEDIDRVGKGVYSPNLRDNAQDARNRLFKLLSDIPGKEAYIALAELVDDHPNPGHRPWMAKQARDRARADGDIEPWTAEQVREFSSDLTATPTTQRQLFDLTVARVTDLKNWLERGNDSPYRTWQKAEDESEIRNLVAVFLNQNWRNSFTIAQEPELANRQRLDIWLQNPNVPMPVPIELKVLDMNWSGPKLCERLRNQLAGDYLRDANERCGVMLLVWKGTRPGRQWLIDGRWVGVSGLCRALKQHWEASSNSFPNVAAIEVVLIDLTMRAIKSGN